MELFENAQVVNRVAITLVKNQVFWDWLKYIGPELRLGENEKKDLNTYLISSSEELRTIEEILAPHFRIIFEHELAEWHMDPDLGPEQRDRKTFLQWLTIHQGGVVFDLSRSPLRKH